jgi:peptidylprolyl isomerase
MKKLAILALALPALAGAQTSPEAPAALSPYEIIEATTAADWRPIAPENLLVMTVGGGAQVFIELAPDFAPVHVENIRRLARAHWFDGIALVRVQDNYVVQWGDPTEEKALPEEIETAPPPEYEGDAKEDWAFAPVTSGGYAFNSGYVNGWPVGRGTRIGEDPAPPMNTAGSLAWLVHCYGMVGVGRGDNPDTGTGAELYTVIGHAPRHLDRNIALAGRIVEGIENLSSLPRGTGPLGFYETEEERTPIASVRLASELPEAERPRFEVMRTDTETFRRYVNARANRSGWFIRPAGAVDVCNVNLPIRRAQ